MPFGMTFNIIPWTYPKQIKIFSKYTLWFLWIQMVRSNFTILNNYWLLLTNYPLGMLTKHSPMNMSWTLADSVPESAFFYFEWNLFEKNSKPPQKRERDDPLLTNYNPMNINKSRCDLRLNWNWLWIGNSVNFQSLSLWVRNDPFFTFLLSSSNFWKIASHQCGLLSQIIIPWTYSNFESSLLEDFIRSAAYSIITIQICND